MSRLLFILFVSAVECGDVVVYKGAGGLLNGHTEVVAFELAFFVLGFCLAKDASQFLRRFLQIGEYVVYKFGEGLSFFVQIFVPLYIFLYFLCQECRSLHYVVAALAAAVTVGGTLKVSYSRIDEEFFREDIFQFVEESAHLISCGCLLLFGRCLFGAHPLQFCQ